MIGWSPSGRQWLVPWWKEHVGKRNEWESGVDWKMKTKLRRRLQSWILKELNIDRDRKKRKEQPPVWYLCLFDPYILKCVGPFSSFFKKSTCLIIDFVFKFLETFLKYRSNLSLEHLCFIYYCFIYRMSTFAVLVVRCPFKLTYII